MFGFRYSRLPSDSTSSKPTVNSILYFLRRRSTLQILLALTAAVILLSSLHPTVQTAASTLGTNVANKIPASWGTFNPGGWVGSHPSDPFAWDPREDPDLRARQLSQYNMLMAENGKYNGSFRSVARIHNEEAAVRLGQCLRGEIKCPKKPVILSSYIYVGFYYEDQAPGGEMIWLSSIVPAIERTGYIILHSHYGISGPSKIIPDLVHMYWGDEKRAPTCASDPRCVAEYEPTEGWDDLSVGVPESERGVIPIARLFAPSWWGCYPQPWGHASAFIIGPKTPDWCWQPMGQQWALTPFNYPNNSFLPWSIEDHCMQIETVPWEERTDTALIYAKLASYFKISKLDREFWNTDEVKAQTWKFLSTAEQDGKGSIIPEGLESIGRQTRDDYNRLLSSVKVVVGVDLPKVSPTVYAALCQGTPVVLPYYKELTDPSDPASAFGLAYGQHPMALALGPPWVYGYQAGNGTDLIAKVNQAMQAPIPRYIPPFMKQSFVDSHIREVLTFDFESLAAQKISDNGGKRPVVPAHSLATLVKHNSLWLEKPGEQLRWDRSQWYRDYLEGETESEVILEEDEELLG
ncbi:hypothetical protein BCR39DRAFT_513030 [Naematelia encephala]|uniref:Glycosyltransferase family 18 catalytic domain-containing protein n=1 Tax=Naematelia encephala TaxID=71784 RepID=A0A1Y2BMC6_9TREE|nr:hypothetical protein BCR39DRAFT_513030 [Naematelia encephala]